MRASHEYLVCRVPSAPARSRAFVFITRHETEKAKIAQFRLIRTLPSFQRGRDWFRLAATFRGDGRAYVPPLRRSRRRQDLLSRSGRSFRADRAAAARVPDFVA